MQVYCCPCNTTYVIRVYMISFLQTILKINNISFLPIFIGTTRLVFGFHCVECKMS